MTPVCLLFHRGFALAVRAEPVGDAYAFRVTQAGQTLHTSGAVYRTVTSADRAARRFVDDALGAYDWAAEQFAAGAYSSSK